MVAEADTTMTCDLVPNKVNMKTSWKLQVVKNDSKDYFYLIYLIWYFSISVLFSYCRLYIFLVTGVSDCICIRFSISRDTSLVITKPVQQGEIGAITYIDYIVKSQHEHIVQYKRESKPGKPYKGFRIKNVE